MIHRHRWRPVAVSYGNYALGTDVLNACTKCGKRVSVYLRGHWTLADLTLNATEPGGSSLDETSATRLRGGKSSA